MATNPHIWKALGTGAAAEIVGVHPITLRKWATAGLVPHYFLLGRLRFAEEEIRSFVEQSHRPAAKAA